MGEQIPRRNRTNGRTYGARLGGCFSLPEPPSHVLLTARHGVLSVSEIVVNFPMTEPTASIGYEDAFAVTVHLKDVVDHEYWLNGRAIYCEPIRAGLTYIHDLKQDPRALVGQPERTVHFYMPLETLNAFAEQEGIQPISDLIYKPGYGRNDPIMLHLSEAVLPALSEAHGTSGLFLDQILTAACAHVLGQYGTAGAVPRGAVGGLAPWQERRAKEMMNGCIGASVSLSELARECRLSVTHFVRAFRQSTGMSPHQWLVARRIEKAASMLDGHDLSLREIASHQGVYRSRWNEPWALAAIANAQLRNMVASYRSIDGTTGRNTIVLGNVVRSYNPRAVYKRSVHQTLYDCSWGYRDVSRDALDSALIEWRRKPIAFVGYAGLDAGRAKGMRGLARRALAAERREPTVLVSSHTRIEIWR